jgi:hypothetical protein
MFSNHISLQRIGAEMIIPAANTMILATQIIVTEAKKMLSAAKKMLSVPPTIVCVKPPAHRGTGTGFTYAGTD